MTRGRGFGETERTIWLLSMPACAEVISQMKIFTGADGYSEKPHKECTKSRQQRDHNDTIKLLSYLSKRNPFGKDCKDIVNISSGKIAHVASNIDEAKEVGEKIVATMTGKIVTNVTFKKKDQATHMISPNVVHCEDKAISIDPLLLFQRLLTAGEASASKLQEVLSFELATAPPSLFDSCGMMRVCQKSVLATCLWCTDAAAETPLLSLHHVFDGGSLLHKINWPKGATYGEIADMYVRFIKSRHPNATVVFDGYSSNTTTKDSAHSRRALKSSPDIVVDVNNHLDDTKESFLSNNNNKQSFINILSCKLRLVGVDVYNAKSDADTLIVKHVLESAERVDTVLVGEDTDLLVLLLHHVKDTHNNITFTSFGCRMWNIKKAKSLLGQETSNHLLFLHALTGCDTTSSPYSIGKKTALAKFKNNLELREASQIFTASSDIEAIQKAGEKALVILYGGSDESLDELRYKKYLRKVVTQKKAVQPYMLPPTCAAAKHHSLRVYHQVAVWKSLLDSTNEDPTNWGWQLVNNILHPVFTDIAPAPEDLLKIIFCKCKSDCSSLRCVC